MPRPVLALSISILPAGTIVMPLCRWGGKDRPKDHPGAELGLEGRAASLGVGSPRSVLAREPETNAQSEYKRQLSGGLQAWQGPTLSLPITGSPPTQGWLEMRLGPREHRRGLAVPSNPCGQGHASCQLPASSWLKARLEAAVTSTLHK